MPDIVLNSSFINDLANALSGPLPGEKSHLKMASSNRMIEMEKRKGFSNPVKSSVLILLYPRHKKTYTSFILRQKYNGVHSGQVSFPGGRQEPDDRSLIETALREAREEVNIEPNSVEILGVLSDLYIPPSNYIVTPVVGYSNHPPQFIPEHKEVSEIIESELDFLFDPGRIKQTVFSGPDYTIKAPYFDVKGYIVWGATAMILSELKDVIERIALS